MVCDVVDFTPPGRHVAAGDDASSVAQTDRLTLNGVEDPIGHAQADDPAPIVACDALDASAARGPLRNPDADRLIDALDLHPSGSRDDVLFAGVDDEGRRSPTHRRQLARPSRDVE